MSPQRAARPCAHRGCVALVRGRDRFCPVHQVEEQKRRVEQYKEQDARRGSAASRGYGKEWRELRDIFLAAHPRCVGCGAPATVAHHRILKDAGGDDSENNLIALCKSCHERGHAKRGERWGGG